MRYKPPKGTPIDYTIYPANKLLACWDFLEGVGDRTKDAISKNTGVLSGFSFPATVTSGWNPGKFGRNLVFDGTNDYVNITNTVNTVQTISFWAKPSSTTQRFLQIGTLISIYLQSGTVKAYGLDSSTIYIDDVQTTTFPNDGKWHNITVVGASSVTGNDINIGLEALNGGANLDLNALYYASAANNIVLDCGLQDICMSAWIKPDTNLSSYSTIVEKRSGAQYAFFLQDSNIRSNIVDGTDTYELRINSYMPLDNKWHHLASVFDRDTAESCNLYLDGIVIAGISRIGTLANIDSISNAGILQLGGREGGSLILDGQIRDVKIYIASGSIWTSTQILYQATHPFDYSASAGTLTEYYPCTEGSGTTIAAGVTAPGNNLTLTNAAAWSTEGQYYAGQIDLVRMFSVPLTQGVIRQLYKNPFGIYRG